MALQLHVNGRAEIEVDGNLMGWTETGVTVDLVHHTEDVFSDYHGDPPAIPLAVLNKGEEALISGTLIYYDNSELEESSTRFHNDAADPPNEVLGSTPNLAGDFGAPMYVHLSVNATDRTHTLTIKKTTTNGFTEPEGPWTFNRVYLVGTHSFTVGTRATRHVVTWRAVPDDNGVLYTIADAA